jgi:hypothetical protein
MIPSLLLRWSISSDMEIICHILWCFSGCVLRGAAEDPRHSAIDNEVLTGQFVGAPVL